VPGGIDSFIKGILKWAPDDLDYTVLGASSDLNTRPLGQRISVPIGRSHESHSIPIVSTVTTSNRGKIPLSVRYMVALTRYMRRGVLEDFDILDFHRIEPVLLLSRDSRPKNVTLHADYAILRDKNSDIMWRYWPWLYEQLEGRAFLTLDRVFTVRRSAVERYSGIYPPLSNKFSFIPTWMDTETFYPASSADERQDLRMKLIGSLGVPSTSRLLVFVGRLDHQKDPLLLVKAFREALQRQANLHLIIIGDGILRADVETFCRANELENRASLLGVRSATQIADILRASDLFVLSSAYEGMCIAVLEALAVGLPVVSTQVGEIDLVLKSGVNGQIVQERSPESLAEAICKSIDQLTIIRGDPCLKAVRPYHPENVLKTIYENHRHQAALIKR
jgi:glycosyltransferase involved in cell wall biosynthesis